MSFDDIFVVLFLLYVLSSVLSGLVRRGAPGGRRAQDSPSDGELGPIVLDMEELERRLRRAREATAAPPAAGGGEGPQPVVLQGAERDSAPAARRPSGQRGPSRRGPGTERPGERPAWSRPEPTRRQSAATQAAKPTIHPSTIAPRLRGVDFESSLGEDWDAAPGAPPERTQRPQAYRAGGGATPAVAALLSGDNPWRAAVILREVLDAPRAARPYRVWPRV